MDVVAEHVPQRRMQQVCGRVIALGVATRIAWDARRDRSVVDRPLERADRRNLALDLANVLDIHAPSPADDLTAVGHLAARFRIEGGLTQHDGNTIPAEPLDSGELGFDLDDI